MADGVQRPEHEHSTPHKLIYDCFEDTYSTRILTLEPGVGSDALVGNLTIENLDGPEPYEAISYVWGPGSRCESILCNGHEVPLTRSLHGALSRMRLPDRPRRLWADQLCINQEDIAERGQQVSLMNAIYKGADRILVWLGEDDEGVAAEAVAMIRHLYDVFGDDEKHEAFRLAHKEELLRQKKEPWVPFSKLTKLPWFNRIWIVQEIGTKAPASLYWGDAEVDWEVLSLVAGVLNQHYHYLRSRFSILTPNIRYLYKRFVEPAEDYDSDHNRGSFVYELHRARHLLSKDPRDHVYAFLGHFSIHKGSKALADIEADYSKPLSEVYYDVAARELRGAETLILLSACNAVPSSNRRKGCEDMSMPSWVPDWRIVPLHLMGNPSTPHRASGESTPELIIRNKDKTLHIHGLKVDTIASVSWTFYGKAFQFRREPRGRLPMEVLWQDLCGYKTFTLDEAYHNGDFAFYALVQTLTNACIGADRSRAYDEISKIEWLANGAAYLVRAEGGSDLVAPEIRELARGGDAFKWSHEATLVTRYRRFAVTGRGYFVMGPDVMEEGDIVAVLYGGRTPFVLRPIADGNWSLLGECYVHGMMDGEALKMEHAEEEIFVIR